ncbi:hypothetical protein E2C01_037348 [Portunus trituberculatus]|uniref:Uncharacterized protein n=1 Tax=Portunus trituberculatus TaxID=210409 RepID=A0A5B7FEE7_PORTR|nr:hypothetical protein [Portunus trituberculatus]
MGPTFGASRRRREEERRHWYPHRCVGVSGTGGVLGRLTGTCSMSDTVGREAQQSASQRQPPAVSLLVTTAGAPICLPGRRCFSETVRGEILSGL